MGGGCCELNQLVKEVLRMRFDVTDGDLQRYFGMLC
jgi:hypothetical protein